MKNCVIITGASGDIGIATATLFLEKGYNVVGTSFKRSHALDNLRSMFPDSFFEINIDVSSLDSKNVMKDFLDNNNLVPSILINNAGISVVGLIQDLDQSSWNNIWNTNVTSMIAMSQCVIPYFLNNGGRIINVSSVWGNCGASMEVAYSTTKGAVNSFTKALAKELAPSNIPVNAIAPGIINTRMNAHLSSDDIDEIVNEIPAGRIGETRDVAEAIFSLASTTSYLTGQIITVDGGWTE